jgi:uncharacterized membrane-anchored protein
VENIATFKGELLYWIAILFSNTLGTSSGDFLADNTGLGFRGGALVITAVMLLIIAAHYFTTISGTLLFWVAFVLTRPLGATAGDSLSKPGKQGGLELGTKGTPAGSDSSSEDDVVLQPSLASFSPRHRSNSPRNA